MAGYGSFGIKPEAEPLFLALQLAIRDLNDDGRRVPCQVDPDPFTSEDKADRAEAAEACRHGCPVRLGCLRMAVANNEPAHVWGGHDFNTKSGRDAAQTARENR